MKLSTKLLAMALAADVRKWTDGLSVDAKKSRLFLAQWLWKHPTGLAQKQTALQLLDLPEPPSEQWPDPLPEQHVLEHALDQELKRLFGAADKVKRMLVMRRIAWYARLVSARIEKDLTDAIAQVEDSGDSEPFYKHTVAAPGKDRKYVKLPGRVINPTTENSAL